MNCPFWNSWSNSNVVVSSTLHSVTLPFASVLIEGRQLSWSYEVAELEVTSMASLHDDQVCFILTLIHLSECIRPFDDALVFQSIKSARPYTPASRDGYFGCLDHRWFGIAVGSLHGVHSCDDHSFPTLSFHMMHFQLEIQTSVWLKISFCVGSLSKLPCRNEFHLQIRLVNLHLSHLAVKCSCPGWGFVW